MTTPSALVVVVLAGTLAAGLSLLFDRLFSRRGDLETESAARTLGYVASAYGIVIGFSIVFLFGEYSDARDAVGEEAAALRSAFESTLVLGDNPEGVQHALICYARAVPEFDWPALQQASLAPEVDAAYRNVFLALDNLAVEGTEPESAATKSVVGSLETAAQSRLTRSLAAETQIPGLLRVFLFAGGALVVGLLYVALLGASSRRRAILVGMAAAFTSIMVAIIFQLGQPFRDDGAGVDPIPITEAVQVMERATPDVASRSCPPVE